MKSKLFLPLLMVATLASCNTNLAPIEYELKEYETVLVKQNEKFRIACFNDLHLGMMSNLEEEFAYLDKLIGYGQIDLIVINGDVFHSATKTVVKSALDYFNSKNIPFAYVYGNHDLEGQFDGDFINRELLKRENCVVKNPFNDNVYGDSNYYINVKDGDNISWQLHFFDSNTYRIGEYDIIHDDQVSWYKDVVTSTATTVGHVVPSLTFMHIPFKEFNDAWAQYDYAKYTTKIPGAPTNYDSWAMLDTGVASPDADCGTYEAMLELGSTKGVVVAHDHTNASDWNYNGIRLIYGIKTGHGLYHDERMMGASYYTLGIDQAGNPDEDAFRMERVNLLYGKNEQIVDNTDLHLVLGGNK